MAKVNRPSDALSSGFIHPPYFDIFKSVVFHERWLVGKQMSLDVTVNDPVAKFFDSKSIEFSYNHNTFQGTKSHIRRLALEIHADINEDPSDIDEEELQINYSKFKSHCNTLYTSVFQNHENLYKQIISHVNIVPKLYVFSQEFPIPYEFMLHDVNSNFDFLGSKFTIVKRHTEERRLTQTTSSHIAKKDKIEILVIWDSALATKDELFHSKSEVEYIASLKCESIDVHIIDVNNLGISALDYKSLMNGINSLDFDILHIVCHFDLDKEGTMTESTLSFDSIEIPISDFVAKLKPLNKEIIFLNICNGDNEEPMFNESCSGLFVKKVLPV